MWFLQVTASVKIENDGDKYASSFTFDEEYINQLKPNTAYHICKLVQNRFNFTSIGWPILVIYLAQTY